MVRTRRMWLITSLWVSRTSARTGGLRGRYRGQVAEEGGAPFVRIASAPST